MKSKLLVFGATVLAIALGVGIRSLRCAGRRRNSVGSYRQNRQLQLFTGQYYGSSRSNGSVDER